MDGVQVVVSIHGPESGRNRLRQHLATKNVLGFVVLAAIEVLLELLHIEKIDDVFEDRVHVW